MANQQKCAYPSSLNSKIATKNHAQELFCRKS